MSETAANLNGTTALLIPRDILSAWDLLHGMMLPSGNDAALALAEHFGVLLYSNKYGTKKKLPQSPERYFINEMNKNATLIKMHYTLFVNPHGLDKEYHNSCTYDVLKLGHKAMKLKKLKKIVSTISYECNIVGGARPARHIKWENTNGLLSVDGYNGIKTGITPQRDHVCVHHFAEGK